MPSNLAAAVFDTHAWVWFSASDARMADWSDYRGRIVISAISLWEVSMLDAKGRLVLKPNAETWLDRNTAWPVEVEPIRPAICVKCSRLKNFHGDPADRLIVATALCLDLPLVTADRAIVAWAKSSRLIKVAEI